MPTLRDVIIKQEQKFDAKQDTPVIFRAVLCDSAGLTTGGGSVWANQAERMVWYRPLGMTNAAQVRCVRLEPDLDLGVLVGVPDGSNELEVLMDDPFLRRSGTTGRSYLAPTGRDFEPGGRLQMWLYSKAFVPLMTYSGTGLAVSVVNGDYEDYQGQRQAFAGAVNYDISGHQPAGPNEHLLVGIYISSAGAIGSVAGTAVATSATAPEPVWPADSVPLSVVDLDDTQTTINFNDDIEDRRLHFPYPGAGSGGAPTDAQYVTLATDATLTDERVLTEGDGIDIADGGAGNAVTVSLDINGLTAETTADDADLLAIFDDTAAEPRKMTRGDFLTGISGGGYPFSTVTVDAADADADYSTIGAAHTAASAGDTIQVGPASYNEAVTVTKALTIQGLDRERVVIEQRLTVNAAAVIENLTNSDDYIAFFAESGGGATFRNCRAAASNAEAAHVSYSLNVSGTLDNCVSSVSGGTSVNVCIAGNVTGATVTVIGGEYTASGTGAAVLYGETGVIFALRGPRLNGAIDLNGATISADSWWYDGNGDLVIGRDRAGVYERSSSWQSFSDDCHGALPAALATWAGAPFAGAPTLAYTLNSVVRLEGNNAANRYFVYQAAPSPTFTTLMAVAVATAECGIRMDDGTDDYYVEFALVPSATTGLLRVRYSTRAGGGVTTTYFSDGVPPAFYTLQLIAFALNYRPYFKLGGPWGAQLATTNYTWTPSRLGWIFTGSAGGGFAGSGFVDKWSVS